MSDCPRRDRGAGVRVGSGGDRRQREAHWEVHVYSVSKLGGENLGDG